MTAHLAHPEPLPDFCFRQLNADETVEFLNWAHENYRIGDPIPGIWHPLIRAECHRMNSKNSIPSVP